MIPVKFLRINQKAIIPKKAYKHDSCFDLYTPEPIKLNPNESKTVRLGFKTALPSGFEVVIRPRPCLSGNGFLIHHSHIDYDYRGEWILIAQNTSTNCVYEFKEGERIAQCSLQIILEWDFEEVDDLGEDTLRSASGYGSSGGIGQSYLKGKNG